MLHWFDILGIILAILLLLRGVVAGVAQSLSDLAALLAGIFIARFVITEFAAPWLIGLPPAVYVPLFVVTWFGSYFFFGFALKLLLRLAKIELVAPLEQVGGLLVGLAKAIVIFGMILDLSVWIPGGEAAFQNTYVNRLVRPLWSVVPSMDLKRLSQDLPQKRQEIEKEIEIFSKEIKKSLPKEVFPEPPQK